MIGVIAAESEHDVIREFFELFKTPWEFYRRDRRYDVLLCAGDGPPDSAARLVLVYSGRKIQFDDNNNIKTSFQRNETRILLYHGDRIPIYGASIAFPAQRRGLLTDEDSLQCIAYLHESKQSVLARIGYDLFGEIRTLLVAGQPAANAGIPALDLHIEFLRRVITGCGLSLTEIPPTPAGYQFIVCLTHDVDNPLIQLHRWDHTAFGFLHRAALGSMGDLFRGRMDIQGVFKCWGAILKLPFVYLGLARDFWQDFADKYLDLEKGLHSTYFVIPFKHQPGRTSSGGQAHTFRASQYGAQDIASTIQKVLAAGCEVGLHGIDAWIDDARSLDELEEIRRLTKVGNIGVRMHWLYYDQHTPVVLEKAGALYDSTVGYNDTVGYRAGTTQVYKPLDTRKLLELPLHVMDTALFYPSRLGLTSSEASARLGYLTDNAIRYGGCLTVNWHDRSIAPERLWDGCYRDLVQDLKRRCAWFATAGQAVAWFHKRRSAVFETDSNSSVRVRVTADCDKNVPGLRLRLHRALQSHEVAADNSEHYVDMPLDENVNAPILCEAGR